VQHGKGHALGGVVGSRMQGQAQLDGHLVGVGGGAVIWSAQCRQPAGNRAQIQPLKLFAKLRAL
jgi:hypothetical protein